MPLPLRAWMTALAATSLLAAPHAQAPGFPGTSWPSAAPESQGLDAEVLAERFAALPWPAKNSPILVVANGHEVFRVGDPGQVERLFSCSKVVTAMVCARLRQQGLIASLDDSVPTGHFAGAWAGYTGDSSWRQFLTMTSDYGLDPYHPLGGQHAYNNNAVDFYGETMAKRFYGLGPDRMDSVVDLALTGVIGRQDALSFFGQWGGWDGGLSMSARDLARLGYLLLRGGAWNGQQLLHPELTDGLFRSQIPTGTARYESELHVNDRFNQQHVTDLLEDSWSFGLWRVGPPGSDGSWSFAAAEGYRGKRLILCPKGSLPDPELEVVLVCLPHLHDEGPSSQDYVDILVDATLPPPDPAVIDIPSDPSCVAALFDDGTMGRLEQRAGKAIIVDGEWRASTPSRALLANHPQADFDTLISIAPDMPILGGAGVIARADDPADWGLTASGPQTFVRLIRRSSSEYVVLASWFEDGLEVHHEHTLATPVDPNLPIELLVSLNGDRLWCKVGAENCFGATGLSGVPNPAGGGLTSLWARQGDAPTGVQHLLARNSDSPHAFIDSDTAGEYQLVLFSPNLVHTFQPSTLYIAVAQFLFDAGDLPMILSALWPTLVGVGEHHVIVSSKHAWFRLPSGTPTAVAYLYDIEGERVP